MDICPRSVRRCSNAPLKWQSTELTPLRLLGDIRRADEESTTLSRAGREESWTPENGHAGCGADSDVWRLTIGLASGDGSETDLYLVEISSSEKLR